MLLQAKWPAGRRAAPRSRAELRRSVRCGEAWHGAYRPGQAVVEYSTLLDLQQAEVYQALVQGAAWLGSPGFAALAADTVADRWRFGDWSDVATSLQGWCRAPDIRSS